MLTLKKSYFTIKIKFINVVLLQTEGDLYYLKRFTVSIQLIFNT